MGYSRRVGRVGALAVATRMAVSIGVAVAVVMATVAPVSTASASSSDVPPPDKTALIMGGTTIPTPDNAYIEAVKNQFIAPTHPGQEINYVAVTTPEQFGPITGLFRLGGLALGPPSIFGLDGPAWPDEPWWKLSGLFDLTFDQSLQAGVADLETAMAEHGNDHLVIYGYSQGAVIANLEKRKLAEQYPAGTEAPDIDFVLGGDLNLPNGGVAARFPGLYLPILDWYFQRPRADRHPVRHGRHHPPVRLLRRFPVVSAQSHRRRERVAGRRLRARVPFRRQPGSRSATSPAYQGTHGDTSYYFFETEDLPLFGPLRTLGVPEPLIDVVEPVFRVIVELGYDRSIPPWEPTPARLIPMHDPATVAADLVDAVGEGINNALALTGSPPLLKIPAPGTSADTNDGSVFGSPDKLVDLNAFGDGISNSLSALNPFSTDQGNKQAGTDGRTPGRRRPWAAGQNSPPSR